MTDDHTLLRQFAERRDEIAFTELVRRHLGMVHGVCLRRTGDAQLAEELSQNVFAALARKAATIRRDVLISGWLHRASCFECLHALRAESSRKRTMENFKKLQPAEGGVAPDPAAGLAPLLDEAMDELGAGDRDVLLMRFASNLSLRQIGGALGKSESAAQRHLQRALEKLSAVLRKRGLTAGTGLLAVYLSTDLAKAAPASLAATTVSKAAIAKAASISAGSLLTTQTVTALLIMKQKTTIAAAICLLAAAGSAVYINTRSPEAEESASQNRSASGMSGPAEAGSAAGGNVDAPGFGKVVRDRRDDEFQELVDRFGDSRVGLAKSTAGNLRTMMDSTVRLADLAEGLGPSASLPEASDLSEEQQVAMEQQQKELLQTFRDSADEMGKAQRQLTELLLVGDAVARGEMAEEEHARHFEELKKRISVLRLDAQGNPNDGADQNPNDGQGTRVEVDRNPADSAVTDSGRSGQEAPATGGGESVGLALGDYTDLLSKPQDLEALDKEVSKANSMLNGLTQMLEAMSEE